MAEVRARPWRIWSLGQALGRMNARIHALPVPASLAEVVPTWDPRCEDLSADLVARTATQASPALLHLDYHPLNVMVDAGRVTGVLDWANVRWGDRRADLARSGYRQLQLTDPFVDMAPFYVWAGAMMECDLRPKLGRPGVWLQESDLARIRRWTQARRAQNT